VRRSLHHLSIGRGQLLAFLPGRASTLAPFFSTGKILLVEIAPLMEIGDEYAFVRRKSQLRREQRAA
jgi:hypothetical protein